MPTAVTHDTDTKEREALFTSLYSKFRFSVRKRLTFLLHGENYAELDDLEQIVWLKVWRGLPLDRPVNYLWLSKVATNAANDFLRNKYLLSSGGIYEKQKPLIFSLNADWNTYTEIIEDGRSLDERVEDADFIRRVFAGLPTKYHDICVLFVQGWKYTAIMARLGVSKRAVWTAVRLMQMHARKVREAALTA